MIKQFSFKNFMKNEGGYTLMELLIVLIILTLISSIAVPQLFNYLGRAKSETASVQITALLTELDFYRLDTGRYPTTEEGLKALLEQPSGTSNWNGPYLKKSSMIIDPWGVEFLYKSPGDNNEVDIWTLGADQQEGGTGENEDVKSWQE